MKYIPRFHHHRRFYIALGAGLAAAAAMWRVEPQMLPLIAGDVFFFTYIVLTGLYARRVTREELRDHVNGADEGIVLVFIVSMLAIFISLGSVFLILNSVEDAKPSHVILAIASVPLGWFMLHTLSAFHYASLYHGTSPKHQKYEGGLEFPGGKEPTAGDFLYYSFVIGMTAQVSDVDVTSERIRRATLSHSIASFFYNTVLLALAVNAAISLAGKG